MMLYVFVPVCSWSFVWKFVPVVLGSIVVPLLVALHVLVLSVVNLSV